MTGNANANHTTGIEIQDVIEYRVNTSSTNDIKKLNLEQFVLTKKFDSTEGNYYKSTSKLC